MSSPTLYAVPTGFWEADLGFDSFVATQDPIGDAIRNCCEGDSIWCFPGKFPRAKGPFGGVRGVHILGWDRALGVTEIVRDDTVGSSDNFILGPGDSNFILERLNLELDDRAGVKTTAGVGYPHALIDVFMYGRGSPHDPTWNDTAKWGVHAYETAGWNEIRVFKWGVYGEHGGYFHNIQGVHNFVGGGAGYLGGCDLFFANRMNEGPIGKGDVNIQDRTVKEVCVGQGGSAYTFRGGMPTSRVTLRRVKAQLGCDPMLATPFNQNICGVVSMDSADETRPGAGDAAYPGGTDQLYLDECDFEVGTVWPGRTGMIRPVVQVSAVGNFIVANTRIKVKRASGAYPIAIAIGEGVGNVQFIGQNQIDGWIDYHGTRYTTLDLFRGAHPECFGL